MALTNETTTRIRYGITFTKQLAPYESIKIELNIDDYVREDETAAKAYDRISNFVDSRVEDKVLEAIEDLK